MEVTTNELISLVGQEKYNLFEAFDKYIKESYEPNAIWNKGGKRWDFEYKYSKASKTICGFYFKAGVLGFMLIFGAKEREKIESLTDLSQAFMQQYNAATTYHDGKWLMLEIKDDSLFKDLELALTVKRKKVKKN